MQALNVIRRAGWALALGLSIAQLSGCGRADAGQLLAEARQQHQRGELRAAVIQLKNVLQQHDGVDARRVETCGARDP